MTVLKLAATIDVNDVLLATLCLPGQSFMYYDPNEARSYIFTLDADFTGTSGSGLAVTGKLLVQRTTLESVGESLVLLTANDNFQSATFATRPVWRCRC